MKKSGKQSVSLENVYLKSTAVYVGPKEYAGPIGQYFDGHFEDLYCSSKSWEKAEMNLYKNAIDKCLEKAHLKEDQIDYAIGGDLNNQIIIGSYVLRNYDIPMFGIFSACASSVQSLIIGAILIEGSFANNCLCVVSSHNATAEKQYRYPTEYGGKKPDSSTLTVTGAGAAILTSEKTNIKLTRLTTGKVFDPKFDDPLDLGRAMAPAAYLTIKQHFNDFNIGPEEYDLIVTGDLSYYGKKMLLKLFEEDNIDLSSNYEDCGLIIYDRKSQDVLAGGSGCASCAAVTYSFLVQKLQEGYYKKILVVATGALLNPIISAQNETIPGIAHAIVLERCE